MNYFWINKVHDAYKTIVKVAKDAAKSRVDVDNLKWWPKKYDV